MRKRLIVGAILTLPLLIIAMRDMVPGGHFLETLAAAKTYQWLELMFATPVVLWAGWPFSSRVSNPSSTEILTSFPDQPWGFVAYLYSLIGALFPYLFPVTMRTVKGTIRVSFEAASLIVVLILLGRVLELLARSRTGKL